MIFRECKKEELDQVLKLNLDFVNENICNGIIKDSKENLLNEIIFVVEINDKIIGYAYGNFEISKRKKTYLEKDEKSFNLEEIFISKEYRNKGIGNKFFNFLQKYAKENECKNIQVVAVSKNYKKLLKFYIEDLGFEFWTAHLIKKI